MLILGIESSCDETSAAVVECNDSTSIIRSNIVASQIDTHRLYGGVVPEIASRAHIEAISRITKEALESAGVSLSDIEGIGVTNHPGLIGALLVGVNFAKALACANGIPLVDVDHIRAHIAAAYFEEIRVKPPFLALVVSGGHTSIFYAADYTDFKLIGATRDDALGEAFDKVGRILGLEYPAGAGFDKLAEKGFLRATKGCDTCKYRAFAASDYCKSRENKLPSPALADGLDFSFSGIKTASINLMHKYESRGEELDRELFAAQFTYVAVSAITKKIDEALAMYPGCPLVVSGGVAANTHLRSSLESLAKKRRVSIHIPPRSLCGDNGAMVASQAYFELKAGRRAEADLNAYAADFAE